MVLGTRPEIVKFSPLIREFERRGVGYVLVHTGQHYSYQMDEVFFQELGLPEPDYKLDIGLRARTHAEQTGYMLVEIEKILLKERPRKVLVLGDTNTTLAGALAARKLGLEVVHIEAGLRSFNWEMPEEINRVVVDHISDLLLAPTEIARRNLLREGIPAQKIYVVGNLVADAVRQNLGRANKSVLKRLGLEEGRYFLLTLHRSENVDHRDRLESILKGVKLVRETHPEYPVVFPVHPRTSRRIEEFGLWDYLRGVLAAEPVGYLDFLALEANARLVLTDSGGVQEEACILRVPAVTLRTETERPETVEVGANTVSGRDPANILKSVETMLRRERSWACPYGERVAEKILELI